MWKGGGNTKKKEEEEERKMGEKADDKWKRNSRIRRSR